VPEPLPTGYSLTLEVFGDLRVLNYTFTRENSAFTIVSELFWVESTGKLRFSPNIHNWCVLPVGCKVQAILVPGDMPYMFELVELGIRIIVYPGRRVQKVPLFFDKVGFYGRPQVFFMAPHPSLPIPTVIQVVTIKEFEKWKKAQICKEE